MLIGFFFTCSIRRQPIFFINRANIISVNSTWIYLQIELFWSSLGLLYYLWVDTFSITLCPFFFLGSRWNGKSWKDIPASVRREFNFNDSTLLAWFVRTPQSFVGFLLGLPLGPSVRGCTRLDCLPARSLVETDVPWFVFEIHSWFH